MRTRFEVRIQAEYAGLVLKPMEGHDLGTIRVITLDEDDPRLIRISELKREFRREGRGLFCTAFIKRQYTKNELRKAPFLHLCFDRYQITDTVGCGTSYDESAACPICGWGAVQTSPLRVSHKELPRGHDIVRTAGGEIIVGTRFMSCMPADYLKTASFGDVRSCGTTPGATKRPDIGQLLIHLSAFRIVRPTIVRDGAIDLEDLETSSGKCPYGHTIGHLQVSELFLQQIAPVNGVISHTVNGFQYKSGIWRPLVPIIVTQEFFDRFSSADLRGARFEVAHSLSSECGPNGPVQPSRTTNNN